LPRKCAFILYLVATMLVSAPAGAAQAGLPSGESPAAPAADDSTHAAHWNLIAEVVKQTAEQPLHFVMSAGPIWLSRCLTAVPWYGWVAVPALAYREWRQWPSKRWWDPALDAAFLVLGVIAATWSRRAVPGFVPLEAMRWRDWRVRRPLPAEHAPS
jgi:hypothetical protein